MFQNKKNQAKTKIQFLALLTKITPVIQRFTLDANEGNGSNSFQAKNQRPRQLKSWSF